MPENQLNQPLLKLIDLNAIDVFLGMLLAFFLSAILSRVVQIATRKPSIDSNLSRTMVLLATVVSLIMAVIGNSLARAFGAIGALSLIRFRTAVKSSSELAYLFMAIAVGMACGSGYLAIATGATGLFILFSVLTERLFADRNGLQNSLIRIQFPDRDGNSGKILDKVKTAASSYRLLSQESFSGSEQAEMLIELSLGEEAEVTSLLQEIGQISGEISSQVVINQS
ncbi:MAG: DUF4956 domain-containing protein [Candidatus Riflebacteria bacterium]